MLKGSKQNLNDGTYQFGIKTVFCKPQQAPGLLSYKDNSNEVGQEEMSQTTEDLEVYILVPTTT